MVFRAFAVFTAVLLIPLITGLVVNIRVYRYFYLIPAEIEYGLLAEKVCVGFIALTTGNSGVQVQPGRVVCTTSSGASVHESVFIRLRTLPGTSVYSRLLKLHVNTTRPLALHIVVEYPARSSNITLVLYRSKTPIAVLQLSDPKSRLTLYVEPGVIEYTVNLHVTCYKQGIFNFRVGVYVSEG